MKVIIDKLNINYVENGKGQDILILHGWGTSIKIMENMFNYLSKNNHVILLDLPGFGDSDKLDNGWSLNDYVEFIIKFMKKLNINNPIIIGHSFGGRIAIKLASEHQQVKIKKIILIDSAGIKNKSNKQVKTYILKLLKNTIGKLSPKMAEKAKNIFGSADYRNASPVMKETLVNVVNEDLVDNLPKIKQSTLLIWGENDQATPISDAYVMESKIPGSGVVKIPNAGHFSFLDNPTLVHLVIDSFINGGEKK